MSPSVAIQLSRELFPSRPPASFTVATVALSALTEVAILDFLRSVESRLVGISALYKTQRKLASIVLATSTSALHVTGFSTGLRVPLRLLQRLVLCNADFKLVGFYLDQVAYSLFTDAGVFISNGVDLQSVLPKHDSTSRDTPVVFHDVLGKDVDKKKVFDIFILNSSKGDQSGPAIVRAREACIAAMRPALSNDVAIAPLVSTRSMPKKILIIASRICRDGARLDALKPQVQKNDVGRDHVSAKGKMKLQSERYSTRMRLDAAQTVIIESSDGQRINGRVHKVKGKAATVALLGAGPSRNAQLVSVTTIGKDSLTSAERSRAQILLHLLQGKVSLQGNIAFTAIWMPVASPRPAICPSPLAAVTFPLNPSQRRAVMSVVAPLSVGAVDVQVVEGPPGTGKTSTIAAAVQALRAMDQSVWLVAQSNVAVKNMAEKLAEKGFLDFKLLVSKEFHFDWHEHLYQKIEPNIVRSDTFPKGALGVERVLAGARVLLCTLSMLSNESLSEAGFPTVVPVETLIVDEASQIELGDYLSPVKLFGRTLRRMVFVGDDKQLAPYGQDDIGTLRSIFEIKIHKNRALMLETCYRLPTPICRFISKHVYEGKLQSNPEHKVVTSDSCRFIDVNDGTEKKCGTSWTNEQEANVCITLAQQLCRKGKTDFRIITPYDPQRALIEKKLKAAAGRSSGLTWEDRVFCVDSFQGNEAEDIIISVVRTTKPGFMTNMRRTNVMLTRCQRAMFVCASRSFLESGAAKKTLVGKMAKEWTSLGGWMTVLDVLNGRLFTAE